MASRMPRMRMGIINAKEVPSIGLQKVVIKTSSMQANVVSGVRNARMIWSFNVEATSAFSVQLIKTGNAASAAP